ncbi:MAG: helix-turn-helix domain-containing protein [Alphaproteobacteria bacterium]|nr:helix-turn-helix domain-containing protein [Alphaproteobacteria bacterium]
MKVITMENTEELEIDVDDIGAILKSNRLRNKKSLEDVSAELCIRKIYLTALEEGDYETLPPIPYGIGYVRTYANYLGLSSDRAVKLYKAASLVEEKKDDAETLSPEINKSNNKHLFLGIIALLLIYGIWYSFSGLTKKDIKQEDVKKVTVKEDVIKVADEEKKIEEKVSTFEQEAKKEDKIIEQEELNESEKKQNTATKEILSDKKNIENEIPAILPENNKVEVKFKGESWAELKDKDKVYFQGVYHKGDVQSVDYISDLFISAGRPVNVEIYVKGVKKDLLAKRRKTNIPVDSLD